ncbi:MAG: aldo/keto reductase [Deltaproteobacteria bacterium]|nr:aldo/keto reductase [Deltaproteobacteria bacterium]
MAEIIKAPFGNTEHMSSRIIFGAAAFFVMRQEKADKILELLLQYGVNHIDVAASYGDAELRVGAWMPKYRDQFFLATKTGERTAKGAKESIQRSLERLQVEYVDLIQFHNLTDEEGWNTVFAPGGALEAAIEARNKGWVRFIGVTGHGTQTPHMHLRSLERFDFDSVLLPYNYMMMQNQSYADAFNKLIEICKKRNIAIQTIKGIARRRWKEDSNEKHFSWYEPIKDPEALRQAVQWVLSQPDVFLNTSSDTTLLPMILKAAQEFKDDIGHNEMAEVVKKIEMEPIFAEGLADPF